MHEKGRTSSIRNRSHVPCAGGPHAKKTTPRPVSLAQFKTALRTASVKNSHPFFACELALWAQSEVGVEPEDAGIGEGRAPAVLTESPVIYSLKNPP